MPSPILRAGFKTTFSSDGPGSYPSDPLRDAGTLVSRKTVNGNPINPEEAVSVEQALRAQTINAAYAGFEEHRLGSLEHGKIADITVLGEDPFEFPPEQFNQLSVDMVISGGQVHEMTSR
jgi:predicted amidohydrolase YtcJ